MNVSLTPEMENFVKQKMTTGNYKSPDEVVYASLRLLQKHDEAKFKALRADIMAAYEQSQRGESTPLDEAEIERIKTEGRERLRQQQGERVNGETR